MKSIEAGTTTLEMCLNELRTGKILVTSHGKPIALIVPVEGLDAEQIALGSDPESWREIERRRKEPTIGRAELEKRVAE